MRVPFTIPFLICSAPMPRPRRPASNYQYAVWLDQLTDWTYWATLTFRDAYSTESARRAMNVFLNATSPAICWWGVEQGEVGGRTHIHCLLDFKTPIMAQAVWQWWFDRYGRAHVDAFDQEKGATHYVSKYVTKEAADYDLHTDHTQTLWK